MLVIELATQNVKGFSPSARAALRPGYNVIILYDPQHTQDGFDKHFVEDLLKPFVHDHHGDISPRARLAVRVVSALKIAA